MSERGTAPLTLAEALSRLTEAEKELKRLREERKQIVREVRMRCAEYLEEYGSGCAANDPDRDYGDFMKAARLIRGMGDE